MCIRPAVNSAYLGSFSSAQSSELKGDTYLEVRVVFGRGVLANCCGFPEAGL